MIQRADSIGLYAIAFPARLRGDGYPREAYEAEDAERVKKIEGTFASEDDCGEEEGEACDAQAVFDCLEEGR